MYVFGTTFSTSMMCVLISEINKSLHTQVSDCDNISLAFSMLNSRARRNLRSIASLGI